MRVVVARSEDRPATFYGEHLYSNLVLALSRIATLEEVVCPAGKTAISDVEQTGSADLVIYDGLPADAPAIPGLVWVPTFDASEAEAIPERCWIWERAQMPASSGTGAHTLPTPPLFTSVNPSPQAGTVGLAIDGPLPAQKLNALSEAIILLAARKPDTVVLVPACEMDQLLSAGVSSQCLEAVPDVRHAVEKATVIVGTWDHAFFQGFELAANSQVPAILLDKPIAAGDRLAVRLIRISRAEQLIDEIESLAGRESVDDSDTLSAGEGGLGDAVRELVGLPTPPEAEAIAANLKHNSRFSFEIDSSYFNPWNRIVELNFRIYCAGPVLETLFGEIVCHGRDLSNAYVTHAATLPGGLLLKAVAVLPDDVEADDLFVDIFSGDITLETIHLKDLDISPQTGGLISLEVDDYLATANHWSDAGNLIQHGKRLVQPTDQVERPGRPVFYETRSAWPMNRETLSVLPEEGCVAQRFTRFDSLCVGTPPSTPSLRELKGAYAGRRAWLIGNGPSVRLEDLDKLEDEVTFCFNRFYLAHDSTRLRASFTVSGDKQMIEDFGDEIVAKSGGRVFLANETPPDVRGRYHWLRQVAGFPSLFSKDASVRVSPGGSSLYVAMQVGYYLGIRDFRIYGADFKFSFQRNRHSSDAFRTATGDGNHFIKNYRSGKAWAPPSVQNILSSFLAARTLIEAEGGRVLNTTHGGELEVFERLSFEDALRDDQISD